MTGSGAICNMMVNLKPSYFGDCSNILLLVDLWLQRQKNPISILALPTEKFLRVKKVFARVRKIDLKNK